ncbi:PLP-dependent aminotransferase family protein [Paracandidimonas soli]|uniref:GntR family transcriptional regulator n=1 Tax=Paracandidimonas soli TaxID=1917182 RepID=A0A4R3V203_9BURK|nr:PLP-dependent aminotransferase family protein [Paracandidimonas soli]TCU97263.1 GntR family transcriptional regulator [Paracandidimonas soli]
MAQSPTRIETVMQTIQSRITSRTYPPGTRLPSVRALAKTLGFSVSTVVEAYERLAAENVIRARQGSGFYVCGPMPPLALSDIEPRADRAIDPLWVSRQALEAGPDTLKPGCGWLPDDWMYEAGMRRALRSLAQSRNARLVDYATPQGLPELRQLLARRMAALDIEAPPRQILLADSSTQAIDLICRLLLEPGDTVLVDDPCYFNFHALLRAHRATATGIPMTPSGPDTAAFETALRQHKPRLYITNSGIHNPTGAILSPLTAHRLLKLADSAGLIIVEDDIFADFEIHPAPRLAAFDGLSNVIHIGSFSKTVSASLRCGYIAARADWIDQLTDLKIATAFGGGHLAAAAMLSTLTDSGYRKHLEALRNRLAAAMETAVARLGRLGIVPWLVPQAGMFLWCQLPHGIDAAGIARACLKQGVVLAPGNVFSQSLSASGFLRFNVAQCGDERIFSVLSRTLSQAA